MKKLNKTILTCLNILESKGYEAYLVGGASRDLLLNKKISDIDINTNASSNTIKQLFCDYPFYDIGKSLGTITVIINKQKIDITPFRDEGPYIDHRRPSKVNFSLNLYDDLKRRDFTINALCINAKMVIIDYFTGLNDLENHLIKAIGNPMERFNEDALRILRAIRFSAQLNFTIEDKTKKAIFKSKKLLKSISNERKKEELLKTLSFPNSYSIISEYNDVFKTFINFTNLKKKVDVFNNPLYKIAYLINEDDLDSLKELTFSKHELNLIEDLLIAKNISVKTDLALIKLLSNTNYQNEVIEFLEDLHNIDLSLKIKSIKQYLVNVNDLKISGQELMKLGYHDKQIKIIKEELINKIHTKKLTNTKSDIKAYLKAK